MNRLHPRTSVRRLPVRATVITGAALGLFAGAAVFGGISSAASEHQPAALKPATAVATGPAQAAPCAPGSTLVKRVCVVHIVRTVVAPATTVPVPAATRLPAASPGATAIPASATSAVASPAAAARAADAEATPTETPTPTPTRTGDDD